MNREGPTEKISKEFFKKEFYSFISRVGKG